MHIHTRVRLRTRADTHTATDIIRKFDTYHVGIKMKEEEIDVTF